MAVVKFSKQTIEPNPLEVDYWVDITSDPYGSVWKYYNGIDWVSLNLNDGSDDGLSSFDYYTKEQVNSLLSGKADVDSVESKVDDAEFANVIQNIEFREIGDNQMEMVLLKYDNATIGVTIPMASETNPGMLSGESFRDFVKQSQLQSLYDELYQIMSDLSLAEKERNDAELLRNTNEDTRISAETNRFNAENTRQSEEANRATNENNRVTAENNRTTAEQLRAQAEGNRESTFNTLKGLMQTTIQEGQTAVVATEKATSDAQKVVDEYDEKVAEQDGKLSELGSEVGLLEAITNNGDLCYIIGEDVDINTGEIIVRTGEYAPYYYRSGMIPLYWFGDRNSDFNKKSGYIQAYSFYDANKIFISSFTGTITQKSIPSNAEYVIIKGYKNTSDGSIKDPVIFYNFGLHDNKDLIQKSSLNAATTNTVCNELIKELYLEGLEEGSIYYVVEISKTDASRYVSIYKKNPSGSDISVATAYSREFENQIIKVEQRNDSGISGYVIADWDEISKYEEQPIKVNGIIRNNIVANLCSSPIISAYLTEIKTDKKIEKANEDIRGVGSIVNSIVEFTDSLDIASRQDNKYVNYESGALANAAESTTAVAYSILISDLEVSPISISVKCGFIDSVPAAIAFYSENTIDRKYYIKESSVQAEQTSSSDFVAKIPSNAKLVVVSNIAKQLATPTITFIGTPTHTELERVKKEIEVAPFILQELPKSWVKVEDGTLVASGAHWHSTKYSVKGITRFSVVGSYYDSLAAAVAFYSKDGTYLSEYTVPGEKGDNVRFEVDVPSDAEYAISCSTKSILPVIKTEEVGNAVSNLNSLVAENSKTSDLFLGQYIYPISPCMDYHHLFMDKIYLNTTATIPPQSIFDVFVAAKLGFKMIEVNVLLTSDGVAVTGHQAKQGGYLQTLSTLDGTPTEVHIPSITFEELRTNYRYKSVFAQYRTPITSLEEFLLECKRYDLTPFVQIVSDSVVELTERIMGKKYVAYNGTRKQTNVPIYEYRGGTIDEIVNRCREIGAPYIYGVSADTLDAFTSEELNELVKRVHAEGCWLGWAGSYHSVQETIKYRTSGMDLNASGWDVPDFEHGDEISAYGNFIKGFNDFTGTFTTKSGIAILSAEQSMGKNSEQKSILAKGSLHIQFKGELGITFGRVNDNVTSDGMKEIVLTSIIENKEPMLYLYAYNDVEIYSISYKVASVI